MDPTISVAHLQIIEQADRSQQRVLVVGDDSHPQIETTVGEIRLAIAEHRADSGDGLTIVGTVMITAGFLVILATIMATGAARRQR